MFSKLLRLMFGDPNEKIVKSFQPIIDEINAYEPDLEKLSDDELKQKTPYFKELLNQKKTLDDLLPEVFAVVREVSKRTLKMRHFDVQLIGGVVMHQGKIAEMKTGEGKTLMSTLAAYLNALEGKGVYIVTVNDYLAKRDSEWMGQVYEFLGLTVGVIQSGMDSETKSQAYAADITYGTNNEFGFDYLRDNLSWDLDQCCQSRRHYAIIDEVDSILIDEARTPLIISGPVRDSTSKYIKVARHVKLLQQDKHFTLEEKHKNAILTEDGIEKIEKDMGIDNIYSMQNMDVAHMAVQCLRAKHLFKRDVDYVIKNGEVMIVDEFTGRLMEGRRYSDGLHQAIEAVEGLVIREESQTLASVTFQNYFRMFPKLAGMTGTAETEAAEFENIYKLEVVVIPTNKPMVRLDQADVIYKSKEEKYKAIVNHIKELHKKGQPVLVGTIAIESSELLSEMLKRQGVPHNVLNAKQHEREAEIVADAGQKGLVTIATNMAGRGTDIVLGEGVKELGGFYVIGSERHESRRIDNQLRGRSGRQGDPGESRFYVALDDDLMRMFGSDRIANIMGRLGMPDDTPIEHPWISKSIERAQSKVEKYHFSIRKQVLEYDDVINKQRTTIYDMRRQILKKKDLDGRVKEMVAEIVNSEVFALFGEQGFQIKEEELVKDLIEKLQVIFPIKNLDEVIQKTDKKANYSESLVNALFGFYAFKKSQFPLGIFDEMVTMRALLATLDKKWMDHIHNMDILREGIGLRAYGQKDPLVEYKIEAFEMFREMMFNVASEAMEIINRIELVAQDIQNKDSDQMSDVVESVPMQYNKGASAGVIKLAEKTDKTGRNDPCPCGSGRKYKKCCMT